MITFVSYFKYLSSIICIVILYLYIYRMLTQLFLDTTDPNLRFIELFSPNIFVPLLFSVVFHTLIYTFGLNLTYYIFSNKILSNQINTKLITSLLIIMFLGFFARFFHVKDIYNAYNQDIEKTRNHLNQLFISWIFIS
jgi:hypothetical protein